MQKTIIQLIFMFLLTATCTAQESRIYIFQGKFNSSFGRGDNTKIFEGRLILQGERSIFTMKEEGIQHHGLQGNTLNLRPDSMFTVFKDHASQTMLFEFSDFNQRSHWYADTLFPMHWQLVAEEKMIGGIPCSKAVGFFKGRGYTAWYAPSVANSDGPWKLGGLPGMILEAYDDHDDWHLTWVSTQQLQKGFDEGFFLRKINHDLQGFNGYAAYVKKMFSRLQASMAAQSNAGCVGCQTVPQLKINAWEKID
jgi:GLPGLI family protein